jgi:translation initiation factor IF-3
MAKNKNVFNLPRYRVNDEIRGYNELRIVGEGIESKITTMAEARQIAESMELDLIEINPTSNPPVVKVASYEKLMYELKKAAKKNKQSAKPLKEIQLSVNITDHDLQTKANNAKKFIENGSKVKVTLTMKGRELTRREDSKRSILEFIVMLEDVAIPEAQPRDDGNKTIVILKKKG